MPEERLARARRVRPSGTELDLPTLDGDLTPSRRPDDRPHRRRMPSQPPGADPLATTGLVFGIVSVVAGCVWPLTFAAGCVALWCGLAAVNGRSRPRAVAAAVLGMVGVIAGVGVAASSVAILVARDMPANPEAAKRAPVVFAP